MLSTYPQTLIDHLAEFNQKPTGNLDWDRSVLETMRRAASRKAAIAATEIANVIRQADKDRQKAARAFPDMSDPAIYEMHSKLFIHIANEIVIAPQHRRFVVDDDNKEILRFLLLYFNNSPLAEDVFPGRGYKLHKNIMLQGGPGVGKTMIMQCFSEYLRRINSPRFFHNLSVTQMVNYYTIHNNFDRYTFFEENSPGFLPRPENVCLNDVGLNDNKVFYGMNTSVLTDDFLLARNDIWAAYGKFAHVTTNLNEEALRVRFNQGDAYGRLVDRFKTYNVIPISGSSRR